MSDIDELRAQTIALRAQAEELAAEVAEMTAEMAAMADVLNDNRLMWQELVDLLAAHGVTGGDEGHFETVRRFLLRALKLKGIRS